MLQTQVIKTKAAEFDRYPDNLLRRVNLWSLSLWASLQVYLDRLLFEPR